LVTSRFGAAHASNEASAGRQTKSEGENENEKASIEKGNEAKQREAADDQDRVIGLLS
jgi:hypothetical protein